MIVFGIIAIIILGALVVGQGRRIISCWQKQEAGWGRPASRFDNPGKFWWLFLFEIFLFVVVAQLLVSWIWALIA